MQADATARLVNYFYGARLIYDAGMAGKMREAVLRAQAEEAKSLKGRAKAALNAHLVDPLKRKWQALRA
jgi:hypothetical protein